ncbi:PDZ domain-containing protein [Streptomyces sp. AJS327]|uniref:S1C family serine protease n=1 Tax=Streptomyces sp. AJS327 TaxID=2545265 RepID=UPI0017BE10AC|nr:trypsin-like peptidase domain-containing protein [Streptomyces sp. AJS327]MBA0052714.1 PDZ domain-containing protein [Streptomyces sp. AJS327]
MSTENEGAAGTPAARPTPTSPEPESSRPAGEGDFPLRAPEGADAGDTRPRPDTPDPAPEAAPGGPAPTDTTPAASAGEAPTRREPVAADHHAPPGGPAAGAGGPAAGAGGQYFGADGGTGAPGAPGGGAGGPQYPWGAPPAPPPGGRRRSGLTAAIVAGALFAGLVGGGVGFWAADSGSDGNSTTISADGDPEILNRSPNSVAGIAAKALPSVVTLQSAGGGEEGQGTGWVYDKEGHIVTNNHVVANAADGGELTATFSDGKKYRAEVVGKAQGYDIAVIKLRNADDRKLTPLPLGKSGDVQVGDATIAIGAPFGLSGTVTTGIVSAKNRPVASSDGAGSKASYMSALQTDASINPGNSGGPLLNAQGAVIGVNSAIESGGGGGQSRAGSVGLGFAIPVNQAQRVAAQLIKDGVPVYAVIGATVDMGETGGGATIAEGGQDGGPAIPKGSPADRGGLRSGDVITKLDDTVIDSGPTLIGTIWTHQPKEKVTITYKRDGKEATTEVTLGAQRGDR